MEKVAPKSLSIDGHDPLASSLEGTEFEHLVERQHKKQIQNILKSYTGYFDVFSELLQNAIDATEKHLRQQPINYSPKIWIEIDLKENQIRVTDNGTGMSPDEFLMCLAPNISFKEEGDYRGQKGVGATFLAYGFSYLRLQTRTKKAQIAAVIRQGRAWAEDRRGAISKPRFESVMFEVPELAAGESGTSFELRVGHHEAERPRTLSWIGATTADQWLDVLRIKTPLGGVYLTRHEFFPRVEIKVTDVSGVETTATSDHVDYYYPHEMPNCIKTATISDIDHALQKVKGDPKEKLVKLDSSLKELDCVWEVWEKDQILSDESPFSYQLSERQIELIERHNVSIYGVFLRSAKMWGEFNDDILKIRSGARLLRQGLVIASDGMIQGDNLLIPLTSAIGYQNNAQVIVHFTEGNPDMGRKTFQPELKELSDMLAVRAVNHFKKYLSLLKPDTGARTTSPTKELWEWKMRQSEYRDQNPFDLIVANASVSIVAIPQQEQDVVALFHELVGMGVLRGYKFYATSQSDRYDSLIKYDYPRSGMFSFSRESNPLGVFADRVGGDSEPRVLEYKYDFEALVRDFDKEIKFSDQIDLVVCWKASREYRQRFYLESFLIGDEGSRREFFGATHRAFESAQPRFELIILEDLCNFLVNPEKEIARQRTIYRGE